VTEPNNPIESTSDERVVNNTMRHQYRVLNDNEKLQMQAIKDAGSEFLSKLHQIGGTWRTWMDWPNYNVEQASRELSIAQTKIEEAVMWATKHITR
jgi:hypothetical protein